MSAATRTQSLMRFGGSHWSRLHRSFSQSSWLVVAPLLYAIQLALEVPWHLHDVLRYHEHSDFFAFYAGALLASTHPGNLYDIQSQAAAEASLSTTVHGHILLYVNPPPVAFLLRPVTWLAFDAALLVFTSLLLGALIASGILLGRLLPPSLKGYQRALIVVCCIGYPAALNLGVAQWGALQLLAAVASLTLFRSGRGFLGGLVLSAALVKPQMVLFLIPALALGRHWRPLAGFCTGGLIWLGASWALVGPSGFLGWMTVLGIDDQRSGATDATMSLLSLHVGPAAGLVASLVVGILVLGVLVWMRGELRSIEMALSMGIVASFVASPFVHRWDGLLVAIPLVLVARRDYPAGVLAALAFGFSAIVPHSMGIGLAIGVIATAWLLHRPVTRSGPEALMALQTEVLRPVAAAT